MKEATKRSIFRWIHIVFSCDGRAGGPLKPAFGLSGAVLPHGAIAISIQE